MVFIAFSIVFIGLSMICCFLQFFHICTYTMVFPWFFHGFSMVFYIYSTESQGNSFTSQDSTWPKDFPRMSPPEKWLGQPAALWQQPRSARKAIVQPTAEAMSYRYRITKNHRYHIDYIP